MEPVTGQFPPTPLHGRSLYPCCSQTLYSHKVLPGHAARLGTDRKVSWFSYNDPLGIWLLHILCPISLCPLPPRHKFGIQSFENICFIQ